MNRKLSAACITAGESTLRRAVTSVLPWVCDVVILDTRKERTKSLGLEGLPHIRIIPWEWCDDFGAARNELQKYIESQHYIWFDSDDQLIVPDKPAFERWLEELTNNPTAVGTMLYHYSFDEHGEPSEIQVRERVIPTKCGEWGPAIHEIWQFRAAVTAIMAPEGVVMKHDMVVDTEKSRYKAERNVRIMEKFLKERGADDMDLRVVAHYAEGLKILGQVERALRILHRFQKVETGGWAKSRVFLSMADCALLLERPNEAKQYAALALAEQPENLGAIRFLFDMAVLGDRYEEAMYWFKVGYESNLPTSGDLVFCRAATLVPPFVQVALMLAQMGKVRAAMEYAKKLKNDALCKDLQGVIDEDDDRNAAKRLMSRVKDKKAFVHLLPTTLQATPTLIEYALPVPPANKLSIGIFCAGDHRWGPEDLEKGLGGSETAVIRLGKELVDLGAHVEIYGPFEDVQYKDGMVWLDQALYSADRPLDVFIAWRQPAVTALAPVGAYKVVWLHDAISPGDWDLVPEPHEIWCLSNYHKGAAVPERLQHLVYLTENGVPDVRDIPRDKVPGRVVYASSPDRGLNNLLAWWPDIKAKVPGAELHVFYGFSQFWLDRERDEPEKKKERLALEKALQETPGVVWRGKVGQRELHTELGKAIVWAYPTEFDEISCIVGKEAQALGAYPVCSRYAALAETVRYGTRLGSADKPDIKEHRDKFVAAVVDALKHPPRPRSLDELNIPTWYQVASDLYTRLKERSNALAHRQSDAAGEAGPATLTALATVPWPEYEST